MTERVRPRRLEDLPEAERDRAKEWLARTPEERLEEERVRDWFQKHRPGPDNLGEIEARDPCFLPAQVEAVRALAASLKAERERIGSSLAEVAAASGLTRPAISRLENGHRLNPTLDTLFRYAAALGKRVRLSLDDEGE